MATSEGRGTAFAGAVAAELVGLETERAEHALQPVAKLNS
jgi:hypothetical protein